MIELFAWWNLIFVLPFGAALVYILSLAIGLVPAGGGEGDADADVDHDVSIDADADADHDVGVEHSVGDHDHDVGHGDQSTLLKTLGFLGVGRVPLSIIAMSFCFLWGFAGWASNLIFAPVMRLPELYIWPSLGIAAFASVFGTRMLARGISRIMPSTETYVVSSKQLIGKCATARYLIGPDSGSAMLKDDQGDLQEVPCRIRSSEAPIPSGDRVVLMEFDPKTNVFFVRPDPLEKQRLLEKTASE